MYRYFELLLLLVHVIVWRSISATSNYLVKWKKIIWWNAYFVPRVGLAKRLMRYVVFVWVSETGIPSIF